LLAEHKQAAEVGSTLLVRMASAKAAQELFLGSVGLRLHSWNKFSFRNREHVDQ
jgi:hypothetical protein